MDLHAITLHIPLDLSAAFDTIDNSILLYILEIDFEIVSNALKWIASFLKGSEQHIVIDQVQSRGYDLTPEVFRTL